MIFKNMLASKRKKKWYAIIGVVAVIVVVMVGLQHAHATNSSSHKSNKQSSKSVSAKVAKNNDNNQKTNNQSATDNAEQVKDASASAISSSTDQAHKQNNTANNQSTGQANPSLASTPTQDINNGNPRQTVMPNANVYGAPGLCLQYVDDAFNINSNRSYSATAAAGKASANGTMHYNDQFPVGIKVPVYWNLINKDDGVNYGHIAIWDGQGGFYWEGNHSSTPNYFTLDEMKQIMNGTRQVNGHYLTENWQTPSLIGWSTSLEGHSIAENL